MNRVGKVQGKLVGGNLTLIQACHIAENRALKMGISYELNVGGDMVSLSEIVPSPPPVNVNIFQM